MGHYKYPEEVNKQLRILGERIQTARVRRRWSKEELATRTGVERRTISRLEQGSTGVALGIFLSCMWVLDLWKTLEGLAAPEADKTGIYLEKKRQPKHVHQEKEKELDF
ncbi:MAG: XRE family transcriptional regulator [Spartobacteria bacterium]|nr:XRE family transcriptional regulator [Spartobacteria bacterium]